MQYPPFSIPPIKGLVQKALSSDIVYSTTYLAPFLGIATTFRLAAPAGGFPFAPQRRVSWVKHCLHSLLRFLGVHGVGLTSAERCWSFSTSFCRVWCSRLHVIIRACSRRVFFLLGETSIRLGFHTLYHAFVGTFWNRGSDSSFTGCSSTTCHFAVSFTTQPRRHVLQRSGPLSTAFSLGTASPHTTFSPTVVSVFGYWASIVVPSPLALRILSDAFDTCAVLVSYFVPRAYPFFAPTAHLRTVPMRCILFFREFPLTIIRDTFFLRILSHPCRSCFRPAYVARAIALLPRRFLGHIQETSSTRYTLNISTAFFVKYAVATLGMDLDRLARVRVRVLSSFR